VLMEPGREIVTDKIRVALEKQNIESRPLWKPMHMQPVFSAAPYYGANVSEDLFARGVCLPSGSAMTKGEVSRVCDIIDDIIR
jgi:dTDP-4-amino-4,6-dideoxygalactose transaminase